jgi:hypothetical protein
MNNSKNIIIGGGISVLLLAFVVLAINTIVAGKSEATGLSADRALAVETTAYNFGTVSMAAGKVSQLFRVENTSDSPVMLSKMSTSCMCTAANLIIDGQRFGPYGMPGHGLPLSVNQTLDPGQQASVEVVFDPAAHGPAGVGRIQRVVTLETDYGERLQLQIAANVIP